MFDWGCMILHSRVIYGEILKNDLCLTIFWNVRGKMRERRHHCLRSNHGNYRLKMLGFHSFKKGHNAYFYLFIYFSKTENGRLCPSLSVLLIFFFFAFFGISLYFLISLILKKTSKILNKVNYWFLLIFAYPDSELAWANICPQHSIIVLCYSRLVQACFTQVSLNL